MDNWAFYFAEMWERLWDMVIYPILKLFGYEKNADGSLEKVETTTEA